MFGNSRIHSLVYAIALIVVGCLLAGCAQKIQDQDLPVDPFSTRVEGEDGILVAWNGNSHGHRPGSEARFDFSFSNNSPETWTGEYCLLLLNTDGVVTTFGQADFSLQPGEGDSTSLQTNFPEDLVESPYGLALVIPGRLENTVTIYVGGARGESVATWPAQVGCP